MLYAQNRIFQFDDERRLRQKDLPHFHNYVQKTRGFQELYAKHILGPRADALKGEGDYRIEGRREEGGCCGFIGNVSNGCRA